MRMTPRALTALTLLGAVGVLGAGCGGDDEPDTDPPAQTAPAETTRAPVTTPPPETTIDESPKPDPQREPRTVPEEELQGDEEPIRSEAVFTGRGGKLTPSRVRVPAFIAIRVILRSGDGGSYSLQIEGNRLSVGSGQQTDELKLPGLLPQKSYRGTGPQGDVRIEASAEPGP